MLYAEALICLRFHGIHSGPFGHNRNRRPSGNPCTGAHNQEPDSRRNFERHRETARPFVVYSNRLLFAYNTRVVPGLCRSLRRCNRGNWRFCANWGRTSSGATCARPELFRNRHRRALWFSTSGFRKDASDCARICVRNGSRYAIVNGDKEYELGANSGRSDSSPASG